MDKTTKQYAVLGVSALTLALGTLASAPASASVTPTVQRELAPITADQLGTVLKQDVIAAVGHHDHDHAALAALSQDDHANGEFDV